MRKLIIALAILALLAVTVYAADNECSGSGSCNTLQTVYGTPRRCDDKKCKDRSSRKAGDTVNSEQFCENSLNVLSKCVPIATKGCDATKDVKCATSTEEDGNKCGFPKKDDSDKPSAGLGDRCGGSEAKEQCKEDEDLFCHGTFNVCVKKSAPGEPCVGDGECQTNAFCNYGTCHAIGTFGVGDYVASATLCESGIRDGSGRCKPAFTAGNYGQYCQANSECNASADISASLCDMERGDRDGWGLCVGVSQYADIEHRVCKGQRCVGDENNKGCSTDSSKCMSSYVKTYCALLCGVHPESRALIPGTDDVYAYSVDCSALTMTPLEDNKCDLTPDDVVKNCDAVFSSYRINSASSLSGNYVALVAAAAALIALVF